jgi:hypothetical protein
LTSATAGGITPPPQQEQGETMRAHSLTFVLLAAALLAGCANYYQSRVQNAERERDLYGGSVRTYSDVLDGSGPTPSGSAVRK